MEQSKRLIALGLKPETADMYYSYDIICAKPYYKVMEFMNGCVPEFKDSQLESRVHTVSAIIAAVCSLLWVALVTPYWWVMLIWWSIISGCLTITKSYSCRVYWLEQVAFGSTFTAAILYSFC